MKTILSKVIIDFSSPKAKSECTLVKDKTKIWIDDKCESQ
jgi:hypothetical protein